FETSLKKPFNPFRSRRLIDTKKQHLLVSNNLLIFWKTECAEKWIIFGSSCQLLSGESKSWDEAREFDRAKEADLVVINTKEENLFFFFCLFLDYINIYKSQKTKHLSEISDNKDNLTEHLNAVIERMNSSLIETTKKLMDCKSENPLNIYIW
uniref:Uncharacterized protein n=1 Tax=Oryzias latipes TaxID=8090 RepID=A0A3P9MCN6_ORYLA